MDVLDSEPAAHVHEPNPYDDNTVDLDDNTVDLIAPRS